MGDNKIFNILNVIDRNIVASYADIPAIIKQFSNNENLIISIPFNYLEHYRLGSSKYNMEGIILITNLRLFVIEIISGDKKIFNLSEIDIEIANYQNLFKQGVKEKVTVNPDSDPYFIIHTNAGNFPFWIMQTKTNNLMIGGYFESDNCYYGLYLMIKRIKAGDLNLNDVKDIYYYRGKDNLSIIILLPFALFVMSILIGLLISFLNTSFKYIAYSIIFGIFLACVTFPIAFSIIFLRKRNIDTSLRQQAITTFK